MWFSKQKEKDEPLRTLRESEIQEKLYGRFRRPFPEKLSDDLNFSSSEKSASAVTIPQKSTTPNELLKSKEILYPKAVSGGSLPSRDASSADGYRSSDFSPSKKSLRILNFSVVAKVLSFVLIGFVAFFATWWIAFQMHEEKPNNERVSIGKENVSGSANETLLPMMPQKSAQPLKNAVVNEVTAKNEAQERPVKITPVKIEPERSEKTEKPALASYYSIQICTYYSESDANNLIEELEALSLPAFHITSPVRGSESKMHLVMLGKDASASDAQKRLEEFKKLGISKKFSDAYVRKVS